MPQEKIPSRLTPEDVADQYFMQHRAAIIDVAAFLDRYERAASRHGGPEDFRVTALKKAIGILVDGEDHRARRVLEYFSDPTDELAEKAGGKGASGVWPGLAEKTK